MKRKAAQEDVQTLHTAKHCGVGGRVLMGAQGRCTARRLRRRQAGGRPTTLHKSGRLQYRRDTQVAHDSGRPLAGPEVATLVPAVSGLTPIAAAKSACALMGLTSGGVS